MPMMRGSGNGPNSPVAGPLDLNLTNPDIRGSQKLQNGTHENQNFKSLQCYTCNMACVYKSIELLLILGVLANLVVIICLICDKRLHKPTYVVLACLALADTTFLSLNLTISIDIVLKAFSCASFNISATYFSSLVGTCWCAANGHLTLMSVVRYLILVHPLKAHIHLTVRRVILLSEIVWFISASFFAVRGVLFSKSIINAKSSEEIVLAAWCVWFLIPFLITASLHLVKLRKVRKAAKDNSTASRQTELSRMSKTIALVLILAFFLPIPKVICESMKKSGFNMNTQSGFLFHFCTIGITLFLLNSSINPFIYAFMSPVFRRSVVSLFKCSCKEDVTRSSCNQKATTSSLNSPDVVDSADDTAINQR